MSHYILSIWSCHLILDLDHSTFIFLMHIIWPIRYLISTCTNGQFISIKLVSRENAVELSISPSLSIFSSHVYVCVTMTNNSNQMAIFGAQNHNGTILLIVVHHVLMVVVVVMLVVVVCIVRIEQKFRTNRQCQIYCLINIFCCFYRCGCHHTTVANGALLLLLCIVIHCTLFIIIILDIEWGTFRPISR